MLTSIAHNLSGRPKIVLIGAQDRLSRELAVGLAVQAEVVQLDEAWPRTSSARDARLLLGNASAVVDLTDMLPAERLPLTRRLVAAIAALPIADRPAALLARSTGDVFLGSHDALAGEADLPAGGAAARDAVAIEAAALQAEALAVRVVVLRLPQLVTSAPPRVHERAMPGQHWLNWISAADAVGLIRRAITGWDISGALHLAAPAALPTGKSHPLGRDYRLWPSKALAASYAFDQPALAAEPERTLAGEAWL
jgi:hypothetical protein